ncbi:MAG: response regulator [bacterium]
MKKSDKPKTVLVVDDDPEELTASCEALEAYYSVLTATCGSDAMLIASKSTPDLIILDVIMQGGQDGFMVFRDLGDNPRTSGIPVIFLTNVNEATGLAFGAREVSRYLGRKPAAFLEKPLDPEALIRAAGMAVTRQPDL